MSRRYEASAPVTLLAAANVASGLKHKLAVINSSGQAALPASTADSDQIVVGTFAQDASTTGMAITINQLQGKITMVSDGSAAIAAGNYVAVTNTNARQGEVHALTAPTAARNIVGVALEAVDSGDRDEFQVLAMPIGVGA